MSDYWAPLWILILTLVIDYAFAYWWGYFIGRDWYAMAWSVWGAFAVYGWVIYPLLIGQNPITYNLTNLGAIGQLDTVGRIFLVVNFIIFGVLAYGGYRVGKKHREQPPDPERNFIPWEEPSFR
jgi:hypothetical protein